MSEYYAKRLRISKESYDYMMKYAEENNIARDNRVINHIIQDHKEMNNIDSQKGDLISSISEGISKEINKEIRRIRLGTNNTDRNTQVIIELLNGLFLNDDVNDIITTDQMETQALTTARDTVQKRIEHLQQKRADYYSKGE
ncbi:hypothetical protein [Oceanobacillus sp. FSL K6-0251]|uniref:hypothetical protein n=1 Tax=Oceanobacillus sp. FSL K6-0251 TaxID=2921602 RepID=UPI0030F95BAB